MDLCHPRHHANILEFLAQDLDHCRSSKGDSSYPECFHYLHSLHPQAPGSRQSLNCTVDVQRKQEHCQNEGVDMRLAWGLTTWIYEGLLFWGTISARRKLCQPAAHNLPGHQTRKLLRVHGKSELDQHLWAPICTQRASLNVDPHLPHSRFLIPCQYSDPDMTNFFISDIVN